MYIRVMGVISLFFSAFSMLFALSAGASSSLPKSFKFCVATAAHQIEGGNQYSDWWAWEQLPGKIKNGERSGMACDHWNRVDQDIGLMQWLGIDQYRFSVEWAKIEPVQGQWDLKVLEHYKDEITKLRNAGIEPMVTIHHFTLPKWFQDGGGWMREDAPELFENFAAVVFASLGENVRDWVTFNEPMVHIAGGYLVGLTPPGRKDLLDIKAKPIVQILRAHARAYHRMHSLAADRGQLIRVGIAHHLRSVEPQRKLHPLDHIMARMLDRLTNWDFIDAVETGVLSMRIPFIFSVYEEIEGLKNTQDFIGVNYYTRDLVRFTGKKPLFMSVGVKPNSVKNDLGWEVYPRGFKKILRTVSERYEGKPILITENGMADATDHKRGAFLDAHMKALSEAIEDGAPVETYCHWSLMDNFEWIEGFSPRFGLFEMDYATYERKARPSAHQYKAIIRKAKKLPGDHPSE